jgi:hypothetical protein
MWMPETCRHTRTMRAAIKMLQRAKQGNVKGWLTVFRTLVEWACPAQQVASGMAFLHERKPSPVLHGDLKAANILLENDGRRCVIADFGLAGWAHEQGGSAAARRGALSVSVAPPEVRCITPCLLQDSKAVDAFVPACL